MRVHLRAATFRSISAPIASLLPPLTLTLSILQVTQEGRPLPPSSYRFAFPVLSAVLSSPAHTPLHDEALAVVALHCSPSLGGDIPRRESLALLYNALGVIPAYRWVV